MGSAEPVAYAYTRLLVIRGAGSISAAQTAVEFPLAAQRVAEEPLIGARGDAIDSLPRHTGGAGAREGDGCARVDQAVWRRCAAAFEAGIAVGQALGVHQDGASNLQAHSPCAPSDVRKDGLTTTGRR